jgi:hypothetical protein
MKFFKALIFAAIPWYPIGWAISQVTGNGYLPVFGTSIISIIIFFFIYKTSSVNIASMTIGAVKDMKDSIEFDLEEKSANFYAKAEDEYDKGEVNKGLWSQAFIKSKGDESLRKLEYMKLRVKQLKKNT